MVIIVEAFKAIHREEALSDRELCRREQLPYASFMRWLERTGAGQPPVSRSGPGKVEPWTWKRSGRK